MIFIIALILTVLTVALFVAMYDTQECDKQQMGYNCHHRPGECDRR